MKCPLDDIYQSLLKRKYTWKKTPSQFTSISSFLVCDSFLRLLGVSFDFHSQCVPFMIINDIFIGVLCGGHNQTQGPSVLDGVPNRLQYMV